ncbi:MAG TPA: hemolysin III family protein [Marinilabiliaceae bacterium]|nr:hemolysin III family protein [Marinilabiliaceae bacterium]
MKAKRIVTYSSLEENLNVWSHAAGVLLSLLGLILLIVKAAHQSASTLHWVAYLIYGVSQVAVFTASTLYHSSQNENLRRRLNVFDHTAIYLSIAGSYTPFTLVFIQGAWGWSIFGSAWLIAIAGIVLKLFYTGRFRLLSTISYVVMGWIIVVAIDPLIKSVPFSQLMWILAGGIFYTLGAALYQVKRIPYNHAIFHFFVLAGAIAIFIAIYTY